MNNVLHARKGMKWVMTEFGAEQPQVRAKFEKGSKHREAYSKAVPLTWYQKGYVIEVKEDM